MHGAAYRGVYDLSDLDRSLFMMAPGQSGNLLSRHARDFLIRWRDGATITLGPSPDATTATIRLTPMIYRATPIDDTWLTEGVMIRRVFAWLIDILLLGVMLTALWFVLLLRAKRMRFVSSKKRLRS